MRHAAARLAVALLVLARGASSAEPTAQDAFSEVLTQLAARAQGHVAFTEVQQLAMLKQPLTSSGELLYVAPDYLEKRTLKPKAESLILDHGVLRARRGGREHALELAAYPQVAPFVESIRATLAGDRAALERYFTVDFRGDEARWTLQLVPRAASVAASVRDIQMQGEHDRIRSVQIRQADGDRTQISIGAEISP